MHLAELLFVLEEPIASVSDMFAITDNTMLAGSSIWCSADAVSRLKEAAYELRLELSSRFGGELHHFYRPMILRHFSAGAAALLTCTSHLPGDWL